MENIDDEEIQRLIEAQLETQGTGNVAEEDQDAELYRLLFRELEKAPATKEGSQLAEQVVTQIRLKKERRERRTYPVYILAIFIAIAGLVYAALASAEEPLPDEVTKFLWEYKSIGLFTFFAFCAIQLLDGYRLKHHKTV